MADISTINSFANYYGRLYGADGTFQDNNKWSALNFPKRNYHEDVEPISLYTPQGNKISTYVPFILRPPMDVSIPKTTDKNSDYCNRKESDEMGENGEVRRSVKCNWPLYGGSKFQQFCSEQNATDYYAMRMLQTSEKYNDLLQILFNSISSANNPMSASVEWQSVFCSNSTEQIMRFIMLKVAAGVNNIPGMHKNGNWQVEQFHYTDANVYQYADNSGQIFYKVLFNLYNPLRSTSTMVECNLAIQSGPDQNSTELVLLYMGFINDNTDKNKYGGFNLPRHDKFGNMIAVNTNIAPSEIEWSYGNTLLKQKFNQYGFYGNEDYAGLENIDVVADVSDTLKNKISLIEGKADSYLMPAGKVNFTGFLSKDPPVFKEADGNPATVYDDSIIYNSPMMLEKNGNNLVLPNNFKTTINNKMSFQPNSFPVYSIT